MFTIKYRTRRLAAKQSPAGPFYDTCEQISGPWAHISQEMEDGYVVVYAHDEHGDCRCQFGPIKPPAPAEIAEFEKQSNLAGQDLADVPALDYPTDARFRPTLYVMNEHGATVAKYDL